MEAIGGISGVLAIVACVAKLAKKLNEVKDSYDAVALNIQLAAIQLATIRDALEAIADWRLSAQSETQASKNLDATLAEALKGCAVLITVIDGKLGEAGYAPGVKRKIRHLWLEDVLKGYMSNLDGQVRALQLLLTSFQCRTVTEQIQRLQRAEAQSVFEQVRADTASLTVGNRDLEDAASVLSFDPSVNFEMDEILLKHPAYIAAYGDRRPALPPRFSVIGPTSTASSPTQAHAQLPEPPRESPTNQIMDDLSTKEELQEQATSEPTTLNTSNVTPKSDVRTTEPNTGRSPSISISRKPVATIEKPRISNGHKAQDPSLVSAVEAFNRELQSAFDNPAQPNKSPPKKQDTSVRKTEKIGHEEETKLNNTSHVEDQEHDARATGEQSDGEPSDLEMITLLPLASHFDISRRTEDTSRPSHRLSSDSRSQATRRNRINDSQSISSRKSVDPPAAQSSEAEDMSAVRGETYSSPDENAKDKAPLPSLSEPLLVRSESPHNNTTSTSLRDLGNRLSTDSDLYTSSITGKESKSTLVSKGPLSTESQLHTSSLGREQIPLHAGSETTITTGEMTNLSGELPSHTVKLEEDISRNGSSGQPRVADQDATSTNMVSGSSLASIDRKLDPSADTHETSMTTPQLRSPSAHNKSQENFEAGFSERENVIADQSMQSSSFKTPNSAISLRRNELVSSDYVKYSNAEQHGLKIILTPEAGHEVQNDGNLNFVAPPSRPPPPVPSTSSDITSALTPTDSLGRGRRWSNDSTQPRYTMAGTYPTSPTERDGSINGTISTVSSTDRSEQSLSSHMTTASGTQATTLSHPPDTLRGQAQNDLHKLQLEHAAAKVRGDKSAQKASLQQSMDIIQRTYLSSSVTRRTESEIKASSPPKSKGNRMTLMPKKSMSLLSMVGKKSRQADLHEATRSGDVDTLRSLLENKVPVNARGERVKTPLMEAASRSHLHCLETLKEFGADEFAVDGQGRTALHMAVMSNQPKAVSWLIQAYPPTAPDMPGKKSSKIAWATEAMTGSRSTKILREASDGDGSRPLHVATRLALSEMASLLLDSGSDIDAKDNWGRTSLINAAILNRSNIVELLLDRRADLATKDVDGMTALHWAAKNNHLGIVRVLLNAGNMRFGADGLWARDWFDKNGDLPIHVAAREGHVEPVKLLKGGRQFSELKTKHGETLIHIAALTNRLEIAKELILQDIDINAWAKPHSYHLRLWASNEIKYSLKALPLPFNIIPLHYACSQGHYEMTELLLENGAWVNATSDDEQHGMSPLMMAVESGSTNLVCLLLARGAKVNASIPATLVTALHMACRRGDLETTRELVRYSAKTAARTKDGRIPEELVQKVTDAKKRLAMESYFAELTRLRYAKIKAQAAENRRNAAEPSLPPQPSPAFQPYGQYQTYQVQTSYAQEFIDPENDAFPDAPPAYTPGPRAPQNLVNRQGVYRPQYG